MCSQSSYDSEDLNEMERGYDSIEEEENFAAEIADKEDREALKEIEREERMEMERKMRKQGKR